MAALPPLNVDFLRSGVQFVPTPDDGVARREWNARPRSSSERLNSFHDRMQRAVEEAMRETATAKAAAPAERSRSQSFGSTPHLPIVTREAEPPTSIINTQFLTSGGQFKCDPLALEQLPRREPLSYNSRLDRFYQMMLLAGRNSQAPTAA